MYAFKKQLSIWLGLGNLEAQEGSYVNFPGSSNFSISLTGSGVVFHITLDSLLLWPFFYPLLVLGLMDMCDTLVGVLPLLLCFCPKIFSHFVASETA